jgi:hypothetical protein
MLNFSFPNPGNPININGWIAYDHFKNAKNQSIRSTGVKGSLALVAAVLQMDYLAVLKVRDLSFTFSM